jgi:hypothetical protein
VSRKHPEQTRPSLCSSRAATSSGKTPRSASQSSKTPCFLVPDVPPWNLLLIAAVISDMDGLNLNRCKRFPSSVLVAFIQWIYMNSLISLADWPSMKKTFAQHPQMMRLIFDKSKNIKKETNSD